MSRNSSSADTAGVIAPPPLIYLGAIVAGTAMESLRQWSVPIGRWGAPIGALLVAAAVLLAAWAVREFKRARTSPKPHKPTTAIVTSGPFRFTRNPIYVSFTLLQLGIGLWAASGWILATLLPALLVIRYGVIEREERYLERKFGDDYVAYKRSVRRWV